MVFADHEPLFDGFSLSFRSCVHAPGGRTSFSFESYMQQSTPPSLPRPLGWPWWVQYRSWWVSCLSFSVWRCLVVVAGLCVAVDTFTLCSRLAFRLTQPPAVTDTFPQLIYWQWVKLWTMSFFFLSTKLLTGTILSLTYYNTTFNQ